MTSTIIKRSIVLCGHKTSVSLEDEFWISLRQLAASENTNVSMLVEQIAHDQKGSNLSSAIRVFLFNHSRGASSMESPSDETLRTMRWLLVEQQTAECEFSNDAAALQDAKQRLNSRGIKI